MSSLIIPVYSYDGDKVGIQTREAGSRPTFSPRGIRVRDCLPWMREAKSPTSKMVLVCEGPTDAIAVAEHTNFSGAIVGCWSSTIVPPPSWWTKTFPQSYGRFIVAGDGDRAGKLFNQKVADACGIAYDCSMPDGRDVRDLIEENVLIFENMVRMSVVGQPMIGRKKSTPKGQKHTRLDLSDVSLLGMIEAAGGRLASRMSDSCYKFYCPLHEDRKDPSLTVDPIKGVWQCWSGCGQGNQIHWIMAEKKMSREAAMAYMKGMK